MDLKIVQNLFYKIKIFFSQSYKEKDFLVTEAWVPKYCTLKKVHVDPLKFTISIHPWSGEFVSLILE